MGAEQNRAEESVITRGRTIESTQRRRGGEERPQVEIHFAHATTASKFG